MYKIQTFNIHFQYRFILFYMKNLFILFCLSFTSLSWACSCMPKHETKKYSVVTESWHSKKFVYTCEYECRSNHGRSESVQGLHEKRLFTRERGNEIVCDGTVYQEYYSTSSNWFSFKYVRSERFNPKKSDSQTLRDWAQENCI